MAIFFSLKKAETRKNDFTADNKKKHIQVRCDPVKVVAEKEEYRGGGDNDLYGDGVMLLYLTDIERHQTDGENAEHG